MCHARASGTSMVSLTRKAGLATYMIALAENSRKPPSTTIPNPIQFQTNSCSDSWAAVWVFLPRPRRRKSTAAFVPSHNDKPEKWINWTNGYIQGDSRTAVAHGVPWSKLQIAYIRVASPSLVRYLHQC